MGQCIWTSTTRSALDGKLICGKSGQGYWSVKALFRRLFSETKIGVAWPASALGFTSMLSDVLDYRSYLQTAIDFYRTIFRNPVEGLIRQVVSLDIPNFWVDYAAVCLICFTILNWSRRKSRGKDFLSNLVTVWIRFFRYMFELLPFRRTPVEGGHLFLWMGVPVVLILTIGVTIAFPITYFLSPVFLIGSIFIGAADLVPRRAGVLLPQLYFRILSMRNSVEQPEKWTAGQERGKQEILHRLREKAKDGFSGRYDKDYTPPLRSHWDLEEFFGTRGKPAITRNTEIAIELQRDMLRQGSIEALRATAFSVSAYFFLIAISVKF